jgi:hypothetical protein
MPFRETNFSQLNPSSTSLQENIRTAFCPTMMGCRHPQKHCQHQHKMKKRMSSKRMLRHLKMRRCRISNNLSRG